MFRKNTAGQFIHFQGVDATTGGIKTGVSWTVRRCIDGTFAAATGTVTEDGTTGWYKFAMSQADTNGNNIAFNFTGTGAIPQTVNIVTTAADPTSSTNFGLTALPTANPGAANGVLIAGTNAAVTINGTAAAGATPAIPALTLTGGAASTTGGGVASAGLKVTGGAGAASTNGAASGATISAGATNTVDSIAHGLSITGKSLGSGLYAASGQTGDAGIYADGSTSTAGGTHGFFALGATSLGCGIRAIGGAAVSGGPAGDGLLVTGGAAFAGSGGTAGTGFNAVGGTGAASVNGAGAGAKFSGGSVTTVSGANGATFTKTGSASDLSANITGNLSGSVGSLTTNNDKTGYELSSAGVTAIWAEVMTGTVTAVQAMRGFIAALLGKSSGHPGSPVYRNVADSKDVITATTDSNGNRSAVTLDLS